MTTSDHKPPELLQELQKRDREQLGEALRRLLAHGSIFGREGAEAELYHWCYQNSPWLEEMCALLNLQLSWDQELQFVQAVPERGEFLLRLKLDATLVLLTLWYEFDTGVRDRNEIPPIQISVQQLNDLWIAQFTALRRHMPGAARMREILGLAQRKNLIRYEPATPFDQTQIAIFPTLKRVIPFQDLDDWLRHAERLASSSRSEDPTDASDSAEDER